MRAEIIKTTHYASHKENTGCLLGGDSSNPTWKEYLDGFKEEFQPLLLAIREALEREGLVGTTAYSFCNYYYFKLDDPKQTTVAFTWRAWGDLMQAIVGKREGYMAYYM